MFKRITTVLLFGGLLGLVPTAALATPAPSGALPGYYTPQHAGHDHGKKDEDKKKYKKFKKSEHGHDGHGHGHHHHHHGDDGAHASGGYDSHRHHPRNW